jgi:hypothetical protein
MLSLPQPKPPHQCCYCRYWTVCYPEPATEGYCTWRETNNKPAFPRMTIGSVFSLSATEKIDGQTLRPVLRTRWDAECPGWEPKERKR